MGTGLRRVTTVLSTLIVTPRLAPFAPETSVGPSAYSPAHSSAAALTIRSQWRRVPKPLYWAGPGQASGSGYYGQPRIRPGRTGTGPRGPRRSGGRRVLAAS